MGETGEILLFGVRVVVDSMRKSVSLNDLSQYEHRLDAKADDSLKEDSVTAGGGYASADEAVAHHASGSRGERKRGVPWTEEEHKLFLLGLKRVGKGDWRGISRNFVKSRTPTQVASHAQKYFLRRTNVNRRRRRSSLFDITTDSVSAIPDEGQSHDQDNNNTGSQPHLLQPVQPETSNGSTFSTLSAIPRASSPVLLPVRVENKLGNILPGQGIEVADLSTSLNRPVAILPVPRASPILDLNLDLNLTSTVEPAPVSLHLSLSSDRKGSSSKRSAFQLMQGYNNGDNFISVA